MIKDDLNFDGYRSDLAKKLDANAVFFVALGNRTFTCLFAK
jgi:hypothetical protein